MFPRELDNATVAQSGPWASQLHTAINHNTADSAILVIICAQQPIKCCRGNRLEL